MNNPHSCRKKLDFDVIFQIFCGYQDSESHEQNKENSTTLKLSQTIYEPVFKACGSCFRINTDLRSKERAIVGSLM